MLESELASMAQAKAEAEAMRTQEKAAYKKSTKEMALGIDGVKKALRILKDYYAKGDKKHETSGAQGGIVSLLEVCEADFSRGLADMTVQEETAAANYDAYVKQDQIETAAKKQDVKYMIKEAASLDHTVAQL